MRRQLKPRTIGKGTALHPLVQVMGGALLLGACAEKNITVDPGVPWIDVHTHCVEADECDVSRVLDATGNGGAVVASLEHYTINQNFGDANPLLDAFTTQNEAVAAFAAENAGVDWLASLPCWHEVPASDAAWVQACKADVDAMLDAGAVGFKDHAGKQFDNEGDLDEARFVGAYNRFAGRCPGATSNEACMEEPTVLYPLLEDSWREVVRYIVEDREAILLTHAGSYFTAPEQCFFEGEVQACPGVLVSAQQDFADWAKRELTPDAARRIIVAHFGFLQEDADVLEALLDAGLSLDTAQGRYLFGLGCEGRATFAEHKDQWVFGTDLFFEKSCKNYDAWFHMFTGDADAVQLYDTCGGEVGVRGMDLDNTEACGVTADADTVEKILGGNLRQLLGR